MILCYIGQVPTNWWPHGVLGALWTRRPIVKVATEPAVVHSAHVLQKLHFFQFFFFFIYTTCRKKKKHYTPLPQKKINFFFNNLHDLPQKRKTHIDRQKKSARLDDFLYTSYIFHLPEKHNLPRAGTDWLVTGIRLPIGIAPPADVHVRVALRCVAPAKKKKQRERKGNPIRN